MVEAVLAGVWHPLHIPGPSHDNKASGVARLLSFATCSAANTAYLYCSPRMPRHGSHIILSWRTGTEKAYPEEKHPPTPSEPHFDLANPYDYFLYNLTEILSMNNAMSLRVRDKICFPFVVDSSSQ